MMSEYWTTRYEPTRTASTRVSLKTPLSPVWKFKPGGRILGFVRAGDRAVFTNVGTGRATKLSLETGSVIWSDGSVASLLLRRGVSLLTWELEGTRCLDLASGDLQWTRDISLGGEDGFAVGDSFVGTTHEYLQGVRLSDFARLWTRDYLASRSFAATDDVVVRWGPVVESLDLSTGEQRWSRDDLGEPHLLGCVWNEQCIHLLGGFLTALDLGTGRTRWQWRLPGGIHWWHPYQGNAYVFLSPGRYVVVDLASGKPVFERVVGPGVPAPPKKRMKGMRVSARGEEPNSWRDVRMAVSESHAFLTNASGHIVALERESGEVAQVLEIEGMPLQDEPIIYENRLLLNDYTASVYCFEGA